MLASKKKHAKRVEIRWKRADLDVHLGADEFHPTVTLTLASGRLDQLPDRYVVPVGYDSAENRAVFTVRGSCKRGVRLCAELLVGSVEDRDCDQRPAEYLEDSEWHPPSCELSIATGVLGLSKGTTRAKRMLFNLVDTGALPPYRVRCIDDHRGPQVERGTLTLHDVTVSNQVEYDAAQDAVLSEESAAALDQFYEETLVMKRHVRFAKRYFCCAAESLTYYQTLFHPAHGLSVRGGQKQLVIEDGLLFGHALPADCKPSEALLERLVRAACAQAKVDEHDLMEAMQADPTWTGRATAVGPHLQMYVLAAALRITRPPYVADHYLDREGMHDMHPGQRASLRRFTEAASEEDAIDEALRHRGTPTDTLTYVDVADLQSAGDCEDGFKLAFDLFRALRVYRGGSRLLRCMAHLACQFEAVRFDNRCEGNECHVFLALIPLANFHKALLGGTTAWLERFEESATRNEETGAVRLYRSARNAAEHTLSSLADPTESAEESRAFIAERNVVDPTPTRMAALEPLFVETTNFNDPLTSLFRETDEHRWLRRAAMARTAPFARYFAAEVVNHSGDWPKRDELPPEGLRSSPGRAKGDLSSDMPDMACSGAAAFSFYRDVTGCVLDLHSPALRRCQSEAKVGALRAFLAPLQSPPKRNASAAPFQYAVPIESVAFGEYWIMPTSFVDMEADRRFLEDSKTLLDSERRMFRNLSSEGPAPHASVVKHAVGAENLFYQPREAECSRLFDEHFDAAVRNSPAADVLVLQVEARFLSGGDKREAPNLYATLREYLSEIGAAFSYSVAVIATRTEKSPSPRTCTDQLLSRTVVHVYVARRPSK